MECYEKGVIQSSDTGGIDLRWGNHAAIVTLCEQLANREGFGAVLADGVRLAAERLGGEASRYAIHVQGQEVAMHDPRCWPGWATTYKLGPSPGRHTELDGDLPERLIGPKGLSHRKIERFPYTGKGEALKENAAWFSVYTAAGLCWFGAFWDIVDDADDLVDALEAATGWDLTLGEVLMTGERINTLRHSFNLREGLNPKDFHVPGRVLGRPPLQDGATAGIEVDLDTQVKDYFEAMGWDPVTGLPSRNRLNALGLQHVADALSF
jgi:aldehyde:ferredoxin oxidoreductase